MNTFTFKLDTLYIACQPELGVVSYGQCQDEALNNLADEVQLHSDRAAGERYHYENLRFRIGISSSGSGYVGRRPPEQ